MEDHLNFGIPIAWKFQLEVYYLADTLLNGLTTLWGGTWNSMVFHENTSTIFILNTWLIHSLIMKKCELAFLNEQCLLNSILNCSGYHILCYKYCHCSKPPHDETEEDDEADWTRTRRSMGVHVTSQGDMSTIHGVLFRQRWQRDREPFV